MSVTSTTTVLPGALAGIKRRGGRLLVVGDVDGQRRVCRRLFGARRANRRHVVVTDGDRGRDCRCVTTDDQVVTVGRDGQSAHASGPGGGPVPAVHLSALADDVVAAIDRQAADGLAPAQLRVCLGPLDPLLDSADLERVSLYLETVLERVRRASGMAHAHLRAGAHSDTVQRLEPLFDAVIEVATDPEPRQRWHLTEQNLRSDWVPLKD